MRRAWFILIAIVAIGMVAIYAIPAVAIQASILQAATDTPTTEASVTPTEVPATATNTLPTASSAAPSATSATTNTPAAPTATPKVVTSTPFVVTATPSTATITPVVVTATVTPSPIPPTPTNTAAFVAPLPTSGKTRRAEIRFMTEAIDTNQIAVDLANDCLTKAQDSQVLALCQQMSTAHAADIQQLHDLLLSTYQIDYPPSSTSTATMAATPNATQTAPGVVVALTSLQGTSYDVAWLEAMTDVHTDLVNGANRTLNFPISAALRTVVQKMRSTATTEISMMATMIARLGGNQ